MRRNVLLGACLALALGIAGCQDQTTDPTAPAQAAPQATTSGRLDRERGQLRLPSSVRVSDQYLAEVSRRAINPNDHVCNPAPSPVVQYFLAEANRFITQEFDIFERLYLELWADQIPFYESAIFLTEATPQKFGYNGEYNKVMLKTERDVKRFWDIRSDDIQLLAMKGTMLQDVQRVAVTYLLPFVEPFFGDLTEDEALSVATEIRGEVLRSQTLDGGNHPLFSFNAFALSDEDGVIPDKIVMGDGILAGYKAVGYDDVAPQAIYAHEFAHHIQFENDYFDDPVPGATTQAELTRYTELMADAYSAYYLTHKRGGTMNRKRVEQFLQVFFQIGDCAFANPGHHGTPNQRMAAARFGFDVADRAKKSGHILTSDQFHDLFVAAYPGLVAPDAT